MIDYNLGSNAITFNLDETIELPEPLRQVEIFGEIIIILFAHESKPKPINNIWAFNSNGKKLWCIGELLIQSESCQNWHIENEFFNYIKKEDNILFAGGFYYNFHINPITRKILKINSHK